jgi:hypothetical protein
LIPGSYHDVGEHALDGLKVSLQQIVIHTRRIDVSQRV